MYNGFMPPLLDLGFPLWLRISHYLNIILILLLIRSGLQILADHPKLYWNDDCIPGSEWLRFGKKNKKKPSRAKDALWTSRDEAEGINPVLGITGGEHNLGSARRWHFLPIILWIGNGLVYVTLLFATGEWRRLVPTSWSIIPAAIHTQIEYFMFHAPPASAFNPYDPLQQLAYFAIVFIVAPLMIFTGLAMAPAVAARFPWYIKIFGGRQAARSIHFLGMCALVLFTIIHVTLVAIVNGRQNILDITLGNPNGDFHLALLILGVGLFFIFFILAGVTLYTRKNQARVQRMLDPLINSVTSFLFGKNRSYQRYTRKDISLYFRINGQLPKNEQWLKHRNNQFADWKLEIGGLVRNSLKLSLADLKAKPKSEQITKHNCIQGWSAVAEWGGISMSRILEMTEPLPQARHVVFTAFDTDDGGRAYYETFSIGEMSKPQTILAYEMNWKTLPVEHGAPLRLRVETRLGFKMVKYLRSIDFVESIADIGLGNGGYKEDYEFFDKNALI